VLARHREQRLEACSMVAVSPVSVGRSTAAAVGGTSAVSGVIRGVSLT